jgi:hypothetical protein
VRRVLAFMNDELAARDSWIQGFRDSGIQG